jgi:uncharacterized protein YbcV (DUF1398 family)
MVLVRPLVTEKAMSTLTDTVQDAQRRAAEIRPEVGGFPVLAEVLRQAGIRRSARTLPAGQSVYVTDTGAVLEPGMPLVSEMGEVPVFDRVAVIDAIRADQAGETTFPEFLAAIWTAGVTSYAVDLDRRTVTYNGIDNASYVESYPAVEI